MTDWSDKEQVLKAVTEKGLRLVKASDELQADREIVLAAVQQNGRAIRDASAELRADPEIIAAADGVNNNGLELEHASDEFKADREIVLAAVQNSGAALEYASDKLKANREVVSAAVQNYGGALRFASDELRADREIVMAAVQKNGWSLEYASDELRLDPECIEATVEHRNRSTSNLIPSTKEDRRTILTNLRSELIEPLPELICSSLRKNVPGEFKALSKRWNEFLENLVTFKLRGGIVESVAGAAATFEKACWSWKPVLKGSKYDEAARLEQHYDGPMYTCEEHPWPTDDEGCAFPPVVQIDLDKVSTLAGVFLGDGFLQLFFDGREYEYYSLRRIPRELISEELMTPLPEDFDEFQKFKLVKRTYSHCSVITDFEKGDFQINFDGLFNYSAPSESNSLRHELDKLEEDVDKFRSSAYGDFSHAFPGRPSQLFGTYEPRQFSDHEQGDPFFTVDTDDFLKEGGGGVIYLDGPNEFSWYWDC